MQVVLVVAVAVAVICVSFVVVSWMLDELDYRRQRDLRFNKDDKAQESVHRESALPVRRIGGRERLAVLLVAVLLLILGAATAAVDEKVSNAPYRNAGETSASSEVDGGGSFDDGSEVGGGGGFESEWEEGRHSSGVAEAKGDYFASHMSSFRGPAILHAGKIGREFCLVRYFGRKVAEAHGGNPGTTWWTTCRYNSSLTSLRKVRVKLALPRSWGERDARVIAHVPSTASLTYLSGRAAKQCETSGQCYLGGGTQLLVADGEVPRRWFTRIECATGSEDAPARFSPCHLRS